MPATPVGEGFVQSLGRPGGNVTGLSLCLLETTGKRLELVNELDRDSTPVAVVSGPINRMSWRAAENMARE
jgi:putative ABC transport system substrate-binding protein